MTYEEMKAWAAERGWHYVEHEAVQEDRSVITYCTAHTGRTSVMQSCRYSRSGMALERSIVECRDAVRYGVREAT